MTEHVNTRVGRGRRIEDNEDHVCPSHSGTVTKINGVYALLILLITLLGVQMLFQIPNLKISILDEVKGLTARIVELEKTDIEFRSQIKELAARVDLMEHGKKDAR